MSHKKYRQETDCLNCGTEVKGKFCSECGQENIETKENFFHLVGHFVSDYFHYDSKFLRSMKFLFLKPGFLTKQYWDGKRVDYIHPLRLYFFIVVMGVLVADFFFHQYSQEIKDKIIHTTSDPNAVNEPTTFPKSYIITDSLEQTTDSSSVGTPATKSEHQSNPVDSDVDEGEAKVRLSAGIDKFVKHLKFIIFFLLPVYALIFKLLYIRRKSFFVDHLIYTMHLQAFAFLSRGILLVAGIVLPFLSDWFDIASYLLIMAYTAISLRYLYHQPWWKTIFKSVIATVLILVSLVVVFAGYMIVSLVGSGENVNFKFY